MGTLAVAGLGAAKVAAQDATPAAPAPRPERGPPMLFLQSFQSGSIAAKEGEAGRYTVTLEQGLGQTIYFSDRPDRIVGATPTPQILNTLGFNADNPPNAALVAETAPGEIDVAVVELFNPVYDEATSTATYDVAVLENWTDELEMGFHEDPTDLATLAPSFGTAHLFIDSCSDWTISCHAGAQPTGAVVGSFPNVEHCYSYGDVSCLPCEPWENTSIGAISWWSNHCNEEFAACDNDCYAAGVCSWDLLGHCYH